MEELRYICAPKNTEKALHTLEGIIHGIAADHKINQTEIDELRAWIESLPFLSNDKRFIGLVSIVEAAIEDFYLDTDEKENILYHLTNLKSGSVMYDRITTDIQQLEGILHGILADGKINRKEVESLESWMEDHTHLKSYYPYDEIYCLVEKVLADGIVDKEEEKELKSFFGTFVNLKGSVSLEETEMPISNLCSFLPDITFDNKRFAFTGKSLKGSRKEISKEVEIRGGSFINNVSKETDFLIYCGEKSDHWAFNCYGRKVEDAIRLRKSGSQIQIIIEEDFWDAVEDFEIT